MSRCVSGSVKILAFIFLFGKVVFPDSANGIEVVAKESAVSEIDNLKGFFVGVDAAYNHSILKNDETGGVYTLYASGKKRSVPGLGKTEGSLCRVGPSVNVGYSHFFGNYYLGLAGDVSFGNGRKSFVITDPDGGEGYETSIGGISYGLKAKGGYYLSGLKSVVYGITGVKWRDVSYRRYGDARFSSKAELRSPSFLLGLGFERPVCNKLSLSAEYECSWRSSSDRAFWKGDRLSVDFDVKQKFREHALKIGVKYHM